MPSQKISADALVTVLTGSEDIPLIQSGQNVRVKSNIFAPDLNAQLAQPVLQRWGAAAGDLRGSQRNPSIGIISDSTGCIGAEVPAGQDNAWCAQLANMLTSTGTMLAHHNAILGMNLGAGEGRLTLTNTTADATLMSAGGATRKLTAATDVIQFKPTITPSSVKLVYVRKPGQGVMTISYSNASSGTLSAVDIDTSDTVESLGTYDYNFGVINGTYKITWKSGGPVNMIGMIVTSSRRSCVIVNSSLGATNLADWTDTTKPWSWLNVMAALGFDLVIATPGINDWQGNTGLTLFGTNTQKLIDTITPVSDLILHTGIPGSPLYGPAFWPDSHQQNYCNVVRDKATAAKLSGLPVELLDVNKRFKDFTTGNAKGWYADAWVHPTIKGCAQIAAMDFELLGRNNGAGRGINPTPLFFQCDLSDALTFGGNKILSTSVNGITLGATAAHGQTGSNCTIIGALAGNALTGIQSGNGLTLIGYEAGKAATSVTLSLTAVGNGALKVATGQRNTALGANAGALVAGGTRNTIIGADVGSTVLTSGANNILIGYDNTVTTAAAGTNNSINIGNTYKGDSSTKSAVVGAGVVANAATDGFLYIPTVAGTPTGAPTAQTGYAPMLVDTSANKLWIYTGAAWRMAALV